MGLVSVVQIRNNPNDESEWWSGGTKETQENGMQVSVPLVPLNAKASQQCVAALSKTDATTPWQKSVSKLTMPRKAVWLRCHGSRGQMAFGGKPCGNTMKFPSAQYEVERNGCQTKIRTPIL